MKQVIANADALIFDFDGTLANTHGTWKNAEEQLYASLGISLDMDHYLPLIQGNTLMDICREMVKFYQMDLTADELYAQKCQYYEKNSHRSSFIPGAREFLQQAINKGTRIAIASANPTKLNKIFFRVQGADDLIPEAFVSCDDVERSKPSPDVFLEAARRLGVDIRKCVIFEDSPVGIQAGKAAGATVMCIGDRGRDVADFCVEDFVGLLD